MPYIQEAQRRYFDSLLSEIRNHRIDSAGDLNYLITNLVHSFLGETPNYSAYNAAIGVLECAKLELYRRKVSPYEDQKISENGDV